MGEAVKVTKQFSGIDPRLVDKFLKSPEVRSEMSSDVAEGLGTFKYASYWTEGQRSVWDAFSAGYEESEIPEITGLSVAEVTEAVDMLEKSGYLQRKKATPSGDFY